MVIKKISATETHPLRKNVLGNEILDYQYVYTADEEVTTAHFGFFVEENLVGILTAVQTEEKTFQFRGMAVAQSHQGKNIGGKLLNFATAYLQDSAEKIWLNARENAVSFYLKNNFAAEGDYFNIEPIGLHLKMSKLIN